MVKMGQKLSRKEKVAAALLRRKLRYAKTRVQRPRKAVKPKRRPSTRVKQIPLPKLIKKADKFFNAFIRQRDGNRCVTPDEKCKGCIQASHMIKAPNKPTRWDERNVHAQCSHHNYTHDQGFRPSPEVLTSYVIAKYGEAVYQELVTQSKKAVDSAWVREKATAVINQYQSYGR